MYWADFAKGLMLDALDEAATNGAKYMGANTAYSTSGANEVTGGSPAYARFALTWSAAAGSPRTKALTTTLPALNIPAATTVGWISYWDAVTSGNFLGMKPLGAGTLQSCSVEVSADLTNNDIFAKAHGYVADTRVVFWQTLPTGLSIGTIYYVIATGLTTDSFRVSTSSGGSAVDLTGTAPYTFAVQSCVPQTTVTQDVLNVAADSINLNFVA